MVDAGGRADLATLRALAKSGADLNATRRGYRALHALIQSDPHRPAARPSRARSACLEWLLDAGADATAALVPAL